MKIKFTTGDMILMSVYGLCLLMQTINCFLSDPGELHQNINICIWISSTIIWFILYKRTAFKQHSITQAADVPAKVVGQKALASAPSSLNTYEKGIYEEGFKDGANFVKNELNNTPR